MAYINGNETLFNVEIGAELKQNEELKAENAELTAENAELRAIIETL